MRLLRRAVLLAALALSAAATRGEAQRTAADSAWTRGDMARAETLYAARLAADSTDRTALHRMGLMLAWKERYTEALHLLDRLLAYAPDDREAYVDRARVLAWSGDPRAGAASLDALLAREPAYLPALQARAQFESWAGAYDAALATYGRIVAIDPADRTVAYDRARVLSWASRFGPAAAVYDSLLARNPADRQALLGLAQVLAWSGRADSAGVVYRRVLATSPEDLDAQRGLARSEAWGGHLLAAERGWRRVLAAHPQDAAALVGLAQTLRWQGREADAVQAARSAVRVAPTDRDARTELSWARAAVAPRVAPSYVYESDSDGNRISTGAFAAGWHPADRVALGVDGYVRRARDASGGETAQGVAFGAATQLQPGWTLSAAGGASGAEGGRTAPLVRASVASPGRYRATGSLAYTHAAVDGTALLVRREVTMDELGVAAAFAPVAGWSLSASGGGAEYRGHVSGETNRRWNAQAVATRRVATLLTAGVAARAFGFRRDLSDGYFDPDFYGLAEVRLRLAREARHWAFAAEASPGVQKVRSDGDPSGSFRTNGSLSRIFGPGRSIGITGAFANAGLTRLSPTSTSSDYRYHALGINGTWTF
ncbi:MAG TPA: tetratricopeptide repeat protein [Longimicrobiaceae bacterium]|nr:tetratricopeptide repeat protein [Longimicrobiaceae bacterium]